MRGWVKHSGGLGGAMGLFALLAASCSVEERLPGEASEPGAGGTQSAIPLQPGGGGTGGSAGSGSVPQGPLTNLAAGALCRPDQDSCSAPLVCAETAAAGVSRCCVGCAGDEVCSAEGTSCEARVREQGEVCSTAAPCQSSLFCRTAQDEQDRCCAADCSGGQLCTLAGTAC